jgi:hypothetical protein
VALGGFARHLLDLFRAGKTEVFPSVAQVIERLHVEGDPYVREAATIGLLEGIQNAWANNNADPEVFFPFLLPESARWWKSLNKFWSGESKHVGEAYDGESARVATCSMERQSKFRRSTETKIALGGVSPRLVNNLPSARADFVHPPLLQFPSK